MTSFHCSPPDRMAVNLLGGAGGLPELQTTDHLSGVAPHLYHEKSLSKCVLHDHSSQLYLKYSLQLLHTKMRLA